MKKKLEQKTEQIQFNQKLSGIKAAAVIFF